MQEVAIKGQTHTNSLGMQFVRIEPGSFYDGFRERIVIR